MESWKKAVDAAKILSQSSHLVPGKLRITEHFFEVPRDYNGNSSGTLRLFARSARKAEKPADGDDSSNTKQLPWLVYLQGGPGFECSPPQSTPWLTKILDKGYQVLCLDQRGTGLSTPISPSTLGLRGSDEVQAKYLKSFRAPDIVRDCEAVRKALTADYPEDKRKWSLLGQSFGGFCATTYLSMFPEGLTEAFICGGLPPLEAHPDEVYKRTFRQVVKRNLAYYQKYPEDVARVKSILSLLQRFGNTTVRDNGEGFMTARRFLQLGIMLGTHEGVDRLHGKSHVVRIVLRASNDLDLFGHLTKPTLSLIQGNLPFDNNPIYAILHEAIYCQGTSSNWSAERIHKEEYPWFDMDKAMSCSEPVYFTGETVYSWMLQDYGELRKMANPATTISQYKEWEKLYDVAQLKKNSVPVYAAIYTEDMYVDFAASMDTARSIKGCKYFLTNMLYHDALRSMTGTVLDTLFKLRDDVID